MNKIDVIRQTVLQPSDFRAAGGVPQWAYVGAFRVLLGLGDGVWETLGDRIAGIQRICLIDGKDLPEARNVAQWAIEHHDRAPNVPLEIELIGRDGGSVERTLDAQRQFVLRTVSDEAPSFQIIHLEKHFAPEFAAKMDELGVKEYPRHRKRANGGSHPILTDGQKAFIDYIDARKEAAYQARYRDLYVYPALRPPHFDDVWHEHLRSREGDVQRGKKNSDGSPKQSYTHEELMHKTCGTIAGQDAGEIVFTKTPVPLYTLDGNGLTVH